MSLTRLVVTSRDGSEGGDAPFVRGYGETDFSVMSILARIHTTSPPRQSSSSTRSTVVPPSSFTYLKAFCSTSTLSCVLRISRTAGEWARLQ